MIIMSTVCNKFITLANSSSDIIDAESFKVGAKICNKLMESVVSKKASTQIASSEFLQVWFNLSNRHEEGNTSRISMNK